MATFALIHGAGDVGDERLAITPDEITAGHCVALSRPQELADLLVGYAAASDDGPTAP